MNRTVTVRGLYRPETIVEALVEAWNDRPSSAIAGLFTANGRIHVRRAEILGVGNAAIRDAFEAVRGSACGGVLRSTSVKSIRIGDRSRLLRVGWEMSADATAAPVLCGSFTLMIELKEKRWQISAMDLEDLADVALGLRYSEAPMTAYA